MAVNRPVTWGVKVTSVVFPGSISASIPSAFMYIPCVTSAPLMRSVTDSPFFSRTSLGLNANRCAVIAMTRGSWARASAALPSRPFDVESGGSHQVKPWFAGRLDVGAAVPVAEGSGLELQGGAVGWFLDRRAAVIEYTLRKHRLTLLVFRDDGLAWPAGTQDGGGGGADLPARG